MLGQFLKWPKLVFSAVYEKIAAQANKTNTSFKSYLGDDANIDYISNVVYEGIPFFLKFGLKPESFNTKFKKHITAFRDKMYSYDDELNADKVKAEQAQELKDLEKAQEVFKERSETLENSVEIFNTKDYPNGISPQEVLDQINTMVPQVQQEAEELTTRAKLLKDFYAQQAMFEERVKSLNAPEQANMPSFTSDMSKEEMREQFYKMVAEARARVNAPEKKKTVRVKRVKTDSQKAAEEAHNIIMDRAQSIPKDMSTWTRVSSDMSREEVIAKVMGVSIEEAKKLDQKKPEITSLKKAKPVIKSKATRKKKTEE